MPSQETATYLITGIMASGKSSVAEALAKRFEKSVHLRGDVFRRMIVNGREDMGANFSDEAFRQLQLRYHLASQACNAYRDAGFTVVYQDVIIGQILADVIALLKSSSFAENIYLIVLCPRPEIAQKRDEQRHKHAYSSWTADSLDNALRTETEKIGLWLDNSDLSIEETVDAILSNLDSALI